jgi:hypothetical protein
MTRRYAFAEMPFNVSGPAPPETVETEGPGAPAVRSLPAPARMERKQDVGAGRSAGGRLPGPSHFSRVAERLAAQRRAQASPLKPRVRPRRHYQLTVTVTGEATGFPLRIAGRYFQARIASTTRLSATVHPEVRMTLCRAVDPSANTVIRTTGVPMCLQPANASYKPGMSCATSSGRRSWCEEGAPSLPCAAKKSAATVARAITLRGRTACGSAASASESAEAAGSARAC